MQTRCCLWWFVWRVNSGYRLAWHLCRFKAIQEDFIMMEDSFEALSAETMRRDPAWQLQTVLLCTLCLAFKRERLSCIPAISYMVFLISMCSLHFTATFGRKFSISCSVYIHNICILNLQILYVIHLSIILDLLFLAYIFICQLGFRRAFRRILFGQSHFDLRST